MTHLPEPRAEMLLMLRMLRLLQVYVEVSLSDLVLGELQIVHMVCVCVYENTADIACIVFDERGEALSLRSLGLSF